MFGLLKNRFSFPTCPQVCQYTQLPSCRYQNSDKVHLCVLSHKQCLRSRCREIGCNNHRKCAGCPFSLPCSPIFGVPLNHFLRLLFKMHCWNSIALFWLCTALDKIPPQWTPPTRLLSSGGAWCRCQGRLPLLTAGNARRRQLPIARLIHHSPELRHYRHCSVSVMHQVLCVWLAHLSSFPQSPVPCLPPPLRIPLSAEMPPAEQSFLSPQFHLFFWICTFVSLPGEAVFELLVCPTSAFSHDYLSPYFYGAVFSLLAPHHCLLQLSPFPFVYFQEPWIYCLINLFLELAVLLQTNLHPFMLPVLSLAAHALKVLSLWIELNICLTYFTCYAPQQAFPAFHKGWIVCSSLEDSPALWHTWHCITTFISQSFPKTLVPFFLLHGSPSSHFALWKSRESTISLPGRLASLHKAGKHWTLMVRNPIFLYMLEYMSRTLMMYCLFSAEQSVCTDT